MHSLNQLKMVLVQKSSYSKTEKYDTKNIYYNINNIFIFSLILSSTVEQGSATPGTRRCEYFSKTRLRTFFFRDHPDFGRKIGKSEMKSK